MRPSIRVQLVSTLVAVATVPAAVVGTFAYRSQRELIFRDALNAVELTAAARRQSLVHYLGRNRSRNANFLATSQLACRDAPDRAACLGARLDAFVRDEGASGAVLDVPGLQAITAGNPPRDRSAFAEGQLARFARTDDGKTVHLTEATAEDGSRVLLIERDAALVQDLFNDRTGLGASGETFLADGKGFFITRGRYPSSSGHSHPIDARPMLRCLGGKSDSMLAPDYRDVEVIHGFQYVPEIGGGCIMAHIDRTEALEPLETLRRRATLIALSFGGLAIVVAYVLGRLLSTPILRLVDYARALEGSRFDAHIGPLPMPRELRDLARAMARMAQRLKSTLVAETERAARLEIERAERRMCLLADASAVLSSSLDDERALARVAALASRTLGGACCAYVRAGKDQVRLGRDEETELVAPPELDTLATRVLTTRTPIVLERASAQPEGRGMPPDDAAVLDRLGAKTLICAPIQSSGVAYGALVFVAPSGVDFAAPEREVVLELARRCSLAMENARLYREARDAVVLRDSLISVASHELRTPLTTIKLQVDLLEATPNALPPKVATKLETLHRQVDRLSELIDKLLDLTRVSNGRLDLEISEVDMAAIVRDGCARLRDAVERTGSALTLHADGPVIGQWDAMRLDQIVTNLLSNAVKYGAGQPIDVRVEADGSRARLVVRDRGIGIAPEHRELIFERFGRAVSDRKYPGLGLGLWIVSQIVQAMGGSITVESQLGEGSTFTVDLPRERRPLTSAPTPVS